MKKILLFFVLVIMKATLFASAPAQATPPSQAESAYANMTEDELSEILDDVLENTNINNQDSLNLVFEKAVESNYEDVVEKIIESPKAKFISLKTLEKAFLFLVEKNDRIILNKIRTMFKFNFMSVPVQEKAFLIAVENQNAPILAMIIKMSQFQHCSLDVLERAFSIALKDKNESILKMLKNSFEILTQDTLIESMHTQDLYRYLIMAAQIGDERISDKILKRRESLSPLKITDIENSLLIEAFFQAVLYEHLYICSLILGYQGANTYFLSNVIKSAIDSNNLKAIEIILNSFIFDKAAFGKDFNNLLQTTLESYFDNPVFYNNVALLKVIIEKSHIFSGDFRKKLFFLAIMKGHKETVLWALRSLGLGAYTLQNIFNEAVKVNDNNTVQFILEKEYFLACFLTNKDRENAGFHLQGNGYADYVAAMNALLEIARAKKDSIDSSLKKAEENKSDITMLKQKRKNNNITVHWLQAYSALKPVNELTGLSQIDNQFVEAYKQFLQGNQQDLRNLIFPVGRKIDKETNVRSDIYALAPRIGSETQAMKIINNSLLKIFKKDSIKSLLLALAQTQMQQEITSNLLSEMGLGSLFKAAEADVATARSSGVPLAPIPPISGSAAAAAAASE